jgi:hypothetical protein
MSQRLICPRDMNHVAGMVYERRQGVTTGRLVAVCFDCRRVLPPERSLSDEQKAMTPSEREALAQEERRQRTEAAREASLRKRQRANWPRWETPNQRRRNAEIRLAWAQGTLRAVLAIRFGISISRVDQIIQGRKKSA